eukprot:1931700-Rhodomonas_salina.1
MSSRRSENPGKSNHGTEEELSLSSLSKAQASVGEHSSDKAEGVGSDQMDVEAEPGRTGGKEHADTPPSSVEYVPAGAPAEQTAAQPASPAKKFRIFSTDSFNMRQMGNSLLNLSGLPVSALGAERGHDKAEDEADEEHKKNAVVDISERLRP